MKNLLLNALFLIMLSGCISSGYENFFVHKGTSEFLKDSNRKFYIQYLKDDEEPMVYKSYNFDKDLKSLLAKGFFVIGYSSFNGNLEGKRKVISQAKKVRALVAIYGGKYTNTEMYSYTSLVSFGYGYIGIPHIESTRRYDQTAIFFALDNKKLKFGICFGEISRETRVKLRIKGGVVVDVIREKSVVYNSEILEGDIITKFEDVSIKNGAHFMRLMQDFDESKKYFKWTIIRDKKEEVITIKFNSDV